jgi:hypothetical protein
LSFIRNGRARIQPAIGCIPQIRMARLNDITAAAQASPPAERTGKSQPPTKRYALKFEITRAVQAVRASGIPITSIDLRPDGTIRLSSAVAADPAEETEFDRWDKAGKL